MILRAPSLELASTWTSTASALTTVHTPIMGDSGSQDDAHELRHAPPYSIAVPSKEFNSFDRAVMS